MLTILTSSLVINLFTDSWFIQNFVNTHCEGEYISA